MAPAFSSHQRANAQANCKILTNILSGKEASLQHDQACRESGKASQGAISQPRLGYGALEGFGIWHVDDCPRKFRSQPEQMPGRPHTAFRLNKTRTGKSAIKDPPCCGMEDRQRPLLHDPCRAIVPTQMLISHFEPAAQLAAGLMAYFFEVLRPPERLKTTARTIMAAAAPATPYRT